MHLKRIGNIVLIEYLNVASLIRIYAHIHFLSSSIIENNNKQSGFLLIKVFILVLAKVHRCFYWKVEQGQSIFAACATSIKQNEFVASTLQVSDHDESFRSLNKVMKRVEFVLFWLLLLMVIVHWLGFYYRNSY